MKMDMCVCVCVCVCVSVPFVRERERERDGGEVGWGGKLRVYQRMMFCIDVQIHTRI